MRKLVIEVFLKPGIVNVIMAHLKPFFAVINEPADPNKPQKVKDYKIHPARLLPRTTSKFMYYQGGSTEPPCEENTDWIIFKDSLDVSAKQLKLIESVTSANSRPIQKQSKVLIYSSY